MLPTTRVFAGFVLLASSAVLGAALASEYWGGLLPCELCLLERWPWAAAITIALVALLVGGSRAALPWVALVLALAYAVSVALAFYHVGVEQHWFAGPSACTARAGGAATLAELERQIRGTAAVLCDKVQWSLFGLSLAGWNLVASLIMTGTCLATFLRARRAPARLAATA